MKKFFTLIAVAALAFAAQANELTVCDNGVVGEDAWGGWPVYGYWFDAEGMTQQIYPAEMLAEMAGGKITALKFYTAATWGDDYASYSIAFDGAEVTLALKEVDQTEFDADDPMIGGATVVAVVEPELGGLYLTFELNEPFEYNGGNLLVECYWDGYGDWGRTYFRGEETEGQTAYLAFDYYDEWSESTTNMLNMCTFTYEAGEVPPVEPTERTAAPVFNGYTTDGIHAYFVEIIETEPSTIYYKVYIWDAATEDWTIVGDDEWLEYEEILSFTGDGKYRVEAYAVAPGKLPSYDIAYEFIVSPITGLSELASGKTVASQRYFNMAGQEMSEANGLTIVVTTYTDGTTSTAKVVK